MVIAKAKHSVSKDLIVPSFRLVTRRIPDRACIRAVLHDHLRSFWHLDLEELRVVGGPARFRDFDHAYVVERTLVGIEIRIHPVSR